MTFDEFFSEKLLVKELCKYRVKHAKKKHDTLFYKNISSTVRFKNKRYPEDIFPPRRQWVRLDKTERNKTTPTELHARQIFKTVFLKKHDNAEWKKNLRRLLADIHKRLNARTVKFDPPVVKPILKDQKTKVYRAIVSFPVREKLIISQTAKYLTDLFEPLFKDCSYAFRSSRTGGSVKNHHESVKHLIEFRKRHLEKKLWVAECDIKGFYDAIYHTIALRKFNQLKNQLRSQGVVVDARAVKVFRAYLRSFSFSHSIWLKREEVLRKNGTPDGKFKWPLEDTFDGVTKIGVPQGGALSCLIANIVLHFADLKVFDGAGDSDQFYARYCDDMVLVHTENKKCWSGFRRYSNALKRLKLGMHPGERIRSYNASDHWNYKSKSPYLWSNHKTISPRNMAKRCVHWVQFVGYQVRYDGFIRIKKASIEKEYKKQRRITGMLLKQLGFKKGKGINLESTNKTHRQIVFRFLQKLISMSVSRVSPDDFGGEVNKFCWISGFKLMKSEEFLRSQLKQLDRSREHCVSTIKKATVELMGRKSVYTSEPEVHDHYGYPFSYYANSK